MGQETPGLVGRLASVQVGKPTKLVTAAGREWRSAIAKQPVEGRVAVRAGNLDGDKQANLKYHGGPDKAVCAYCSEHYPMWREALDRPDMGPGAFGENFTLEGLTEESVCVGDVFAVGDSVVVQVSQPRIPCVNLARRWDRAELPDRVMKTGRSGFYLRVLQEGEAGAGDMVVLRERPHPGWTILRANALLYGEAADADDIAALRALPALTGEWRRALGRKLKSAAG